VPYNHIIGIIDRNSTNKWGNWSSGSMDRACCSELPAAQLVAYQQPKPGPIQCSSTHGLSIPNCLMKADPRATRFGIFQFKQTVSSSTARITTLFGRLGTQIIQMVMGGTIADPAGPVEHAPLRFSTPGGGNGIYFPATCVLIMPPVPAIARAIPMGTE